MQRRKFVIGMGALASGTAAAIGTGAFSSVSANRDIDVEVADDASAYLRLEGTGGDNADYVTDDGNDGTLTIDLSPSNDGVAGGGEGVNPDAVTQIGNLFDIENQGTQEVDVIVAKHGDNADLVAFYPDGEAYDGDSLTDSAVTLGAGESTTICLEIDTEDSGLGDGDELLDSVTFSATA
ncbi:DUF1102 domain-containing protein [Haloterrigena salifodinae]|nr:DUF1102 domain-containing protein [Haloterrigena salifodinae]